MILGRERLFWHIFSSYLLITLAAVAVVARYTASSAGNFAHERAASGLEARARLAAGRIQDGLEAGNERRAADICREFDEALSTRITIIRGAGKVIADSRKDSAQMDDHSGRPEVMAAMKDGAGAATRYSAALDEELMYVAVRIDRDGEAAGVARASVPIASIEESLEPVYTEIAMYSLVVAAAAAVLCFFVSRATSRPLEKLAREAERFAAGDFTGRAAIPRLKEMSSLAETLNRIATELDARIQTVIRLRNEQEAIVSHVPEGILCVDASGEVTRINPPAGRMLGVDAEDVAGRRLEDAVGNTALEEFVARALAASEPVEGEITVEHGGGRQLKLRGVVLRDADDEQAGAVILMQESDSSG